MVVQLTIEAIDAVTPPITAVEGQAWAIGAGATGAWSDHVGELATWRNGGWLFVTPRIGWRAWDMTTATAISYDGTSWTPIHSDPDFQNLTGIGVNTTFDTTNRSAVASDASLLSHAGNDHQLKINKASVSDTASLLYQSNWSGRAEMGLAGNDDFSVKVSADGSTFTEALRIDGPTGTVTMPTTPSRHVTPYIYRYYMHSDNRWVGPSSNGSSFYTTSNMGTGTEPDMDWDGKGLFLLAGTDLRKFTMAGHSNSSEIVNIDLRFYFQYGSWNGSWSSDAQTTRDIIRSETDTDASANIGMSKAVYPLNYVTPADGYFAIAAQPSTSTTITALRYYYCSGLLDFNLMPNA